jgi:SecD/SecF GG Motif
VAPNLYKYGLDLTGGSLVVVGVRQEESVSRHAALMFFSLAIGRVSKKVCIGVLP